MKKQGSCWPSPKRDSFYEILEGSRYDAALYCCRALCVMVVAVSFFAIAAPSAMGAEPPFVRINPIIATGETTASVEVEAEVFENPEGLGVSVEASTQEEPWAPVSGGPAGQFNPGETGAKTLTARVENLEPETKYYFRVRIAGFTASGEDAEYFPETNYPFATTGAATPVPPIISDEEVTGVGSTEVTLAATINPRRFSTTYAFEYAPASVIESPEGWLSPEVHRSENLPVLPAANNGSRVSEHLTGLTPGARYAWRVSALNAGGPAVGAGGEFSPQSPPTGALGNCPNEQFRVGFAAFLPDCRAYEQATPTDKNGVGVQGLADWLVASSDPAPPRVSFIATAATGIPAGGGGRQEFTPMLSSLVEGSWSTERLFPTETAQARVVNFLGESENLQFAVVEARDAPGISDPATPTLDLIDTETEAVTAIAVGEGKVAGHPFAIDACANDGGWVLFESSAPLVSVAGGAPGRNNLYRWDRGTNSVSVVGKLPAAEGGGAPVRGSFGGGYDWYATENPSTGGAQDGQYVQAIHAVGPAGDQIYFTAAETGQSDSGQIYLRRGLGGPTPTTVNVSRANEGVVDRVVEEEFFGVPFPAAFQEATPDGSKAFFTSPQKLTSDAATGEFDQGNDLYVFKREASPTHALVDVTGGLENSTTPNGAQIKGLLGTNAAGTAGYFVGLGAILPGSTSGEPNIYRFEETGEGIFALSFIATLSNQDRSNWSTGTYSNGLVESGNVFLGKTSRVGESGEELLFTSVANQTGYDSRGCARASNPGGKPCSEIYLYSTADQKVTCISCDPTGERPIGAAELTNTFLNVGVFQSPAGLRPQSHLTRNLSADGERVFFQTPDALLPGDHNTPGCRYLEGLQGLIPTCVDVYEWESPGVPGGTCTKAEVNGGCLYLLSTGNSADRADLVDASADGSNVFIATSSPLVPVDRDQLYDLYDVRSGGGLAAQFANPATACGNEECRLAATLPNAPPSPGSSSFVGSGNGRPSQKCHRGTKKRHGKCVRNKRKKRKHGHKHGKGSASHGRTGSNKGGAK